MLKRGKVGSADWGQESRGAFCTCELWDADQTSKYLELWKTLTCTYEHHQHSDTTGALGLDGIRECT